MKNTIRTFTLLLFIFGLGVVMPKMIRSGMVARGESGSIYAAEAESDMNEVATPSTVTEEEKTAVILESEEKTAESQPAPEEIEGNFPINTAEGSQGVSSETKTEPKTAPAVVDNNQSNIDNTKAKPEESPKETPAPAEPTSSAPVATTPVKVEITYTTVSYVRWVTTPLNLRKGPGTDFGVITSIPLAEKLTVTSTSSNGWSLVTYNGKEGYVSSKYLSESEVKKPAPVAAPAPAPPKASGSSYEAYKMYIGGKAITYKNGGIANGQKIIDGNSSLISTWGGAETFSGNDGYNTHFIGHNPGIFSVMTRMSTGDTIIVTDGSGNPTTYRITRIFKVDDNAQNHSDGENYYNYMVGKRGGEVITLQTCLSSNENLVIRAEKVN